MPVYLLYGFRWPRAGFTGIRVYIVLHNLEDATAEYLQQPETTRLLLGSLQKNEGDIMARLPELRFIEQYDPEDTTSNTAVSQPFAYVAAKTIEIPNPEAPGSGISWNIEDLSKESPLEEGVEGALAELKDKYAAGERVGWWIVYNGDPERYYPEDEEIEDEDVDEDDIMEGDENGNGIPQDQQRSLRTGTSSTSFQSRLTKLFKKNSDSTT